MKTKYAVHCVLIAIWVLVFTFFPPAIQFSESTPWLDEIKAWQSLLAGVTFLPPTVQFNESTPWLEEIKAWQSLIAGVLAVLAAYMTICQMRKTDKQAQVNHRKTMRAVTIRERNMMTALVWHIQEAGCLCTKTFLKYKNFNSDDTGKTDALSDAISDIRQCISKIKEEIYHDDLKSVEYLLDPSYIKELNSVRAILSEKANISTNLIDSFDATFDTIARICSILSDLSTKVARWRDREIEAMDVDVNYD